MTDHASAGRDLPDHVAERDPVVDARKVGTFLALAFGISWTSALVLYLAGVELGTLRGMVLLVGLFMWAPAVAAIVVQVRAGESIRGGCGLRLGRPAWIAIGWLAPLAVVAATIGVGTLLPGASFTPDYGAFLLEMGLTEAQVEEAIAGIEAFPGPPAALFVLQGLLAGATINALAALGEELGWRGLLLAELSPLGFWRLSGLTGVVWGVWHAPVVLQGHNFPESPVAGVLVMTVATLALSPVYTYLTLRARSVLAATVFHGTFNSLGALVLVYLTGAGDLLVSPVGAAVLATANCYAHDRFVAAERVTTGEPLDPFP